MVHQTRCYDLTNDPTNDLINDPGVPGGSRVPTSRRSAQDRVAVDLPE